MGFPCGYMAMRRIDGKNWIIVPKGTYFVLGDNRNDSLDNAIWEFSPKKYILGKVTMMFLPKRRSF